MKFGFLEKIFLKERPPRLSNAEAEKIIAEKVDMEWLKKELSENQAGKRILLGNPRTLESLARLVLELKNKLPEYDTIISDDASGRLVTLFLGEIIRGKRDKSRKPLQTYFLASGQHQEERIDSTIADFIAKKKQELGKTLLVTEYIATGASIQRLIDVLEREQVDFDLAAISIAEHPGNYDESIGSRLYFGFIGSPGLSFYGEHSYAGVIKSKAVAGPHPIVNRPVYPGEGRNVPDAREAMKMTAEAMRGLAD